MIIKVISREREQDESSIRAMVRYVLAEREQDEDDGKRIPGYGGCTFGATEDEGDIQIRHFIELARSSPQCQKPMMHVAIAWDEGETPSPAQVRQAVQIWAAEVGASDLDMIWATHGNTQYRHTHVLVSLVDPLTGRARDLGLWKRKSQKAKARIIGLQGLVPCADDLYLPAQDGGVVMNSDARHWGGHGKGGPDALASLEDGKDAMQIARDAVLPALAKSETWDAFHSALVEAGVRLRKSGSGLLFVLEDGAEVAGSKISKRKCSLRQLEKQLGPYVEGPATVAPASEGSDGDVKNPAARHWHLQAPDGPELPPPLCPEAQAVETRHGVKSRQRLAQEKVPAALERAEVAGGGWQAFHAALAKDGITVRPSGNGLVYVVGGVELRASHVSRCRCGNRKLEDSFGAFEPAPLKMLAQAENMVASMAPEPVDDMEPALIPWWEDYMRERAAWLEEEQRLTEKHQAERRRLRDRLREELDAQLAEATEELRRARALGGRRSLPRGAGAALRLALQARSQARGRVMRKVLAEETRRTRRRFPDSFADWLELQGQAVLADAWRRRGSAGPQQAPESEEPEDGPRPGL